jgi:hypothetical protein
LGTKIEAKTSARNAFQEPRWAPKLPPQMLPGTPFKSNPWSQNCHQNCRQRRSSTAALGAKIAGTNAAKNAYEELPWEPKLKPKLRPGTPFKSHVGSPNCRHNCCQEHLSRAIIGAQIVTKTAARGAHQQPPWEPKLSPQLRPATPFKSNLGNTNCRHNCRQERSSTATVGAIIVTQGTARNAHQEPPWEQKLPPQRGQERSSRDNGGATIFTKDRTVYLQRARQTP